MTSFRRVAFPLGFAAICGGALLFSLSTANGQPSPPSPSGGPPSTMSPSTSMSAPSGMPGVPGGPGSAGAAPAAGAATASTTTGSPPLKQTIGVSPVQVGQKPFIVIGGTGNETYDLQYENVLSLLRQRGVPIPNVLHPLSTAKPSFIVERLIVLSLTGGNNSNSNSNNSGTSGSTQSQPANSGPGMTGAAGTSPQTPSEPSDAEKTVRAVVQVVDAEISRGTGRLGGAHLRKLQLLSRAIHSLVAANRVGAIVTQAIGGAQGKAGASAGGGAGTGDKDKLDLRELFYGRARNSARRADLYTPNIP